MTVKIESAALRLIARNNTWAGSDMLLKISRSAQQFNDKMAFDLDARFRRLANDREGYKVPERERELKEDLQAFLLQFIIAAKQKVDAASANLSVTNLTPVISMESAVQELELYIQLANFFNEGMGYLVRPLENALVRLALTRETNTNKIQVKATTNFYPGMILRVFHGTQLSPERGEWIADFDKASGGTIEIDRGDNYSTVKCEVLSSTGEIPSMGGWLKAEFIPGIPRTIPKMLAQLTPGVVTKPPFVDEDTTTLILVKNVENGSVFLSTLVKTNSLD